MGEFNKEEGEELVRHARNSIEMYLDRGVVIDDEPKNEKFREKRGVFVTLETFPERELRGCIGYPLPFRPLWRAVTECAISAAVGDPRFNPVRKEELDKLVVEVSVLTEPMRIVAKPEDLPKAIKVGVDGLIIEKGGYSGLLLPQVPVEWGWNEEEFLSHTCMKAGLPKDEWRKGGCDVYKFTAQVFSEERPRGEVFIKKLGD
ncbi:MAG: TIGR00296 family protein [Candidatus Micrarchaeia archaeon]